MHSNTPKENEPAAAAATLAELLKAKKDDSFATKAHWWLNEQIPLVEAFFVAVSLHVVAFPVMWFIGWALPWPKAPVITTIIEYDLTQWKKNLPSPKKIFEYRDPKLNQ